MPRVRLLMIAVGALLLSLALASPAAALVKRPVLQEVGPDGTATTQFENQQDKVAYDGVLDRVYQYVKTTNAGLRRIHALDASVPGIFTPLGGSFPLAPENGAEFSDLAVNDATGNIYFQSEATDTVYAFDSTGAPLAGNFPLTVAEPRNLCGVAVDPSGNIWVSDDSARLLRKYDPTGSPLVAENVNVATIGNGRLCAIDFAANGDIYAVERSGSQQTHRITAASGYTSATVFDSESQSRDVAVDRSTGRVVVAHFFRMKEFEPDGTLFREFGTWADVPNAEFGNANFGGVDFDESGDRLFASWGQGPRRIYVFGPRVVLPDITNDPVGAIERTSVEISGTIDLAGGPEVTECFVQYGLGPFANPPYGTPKSTEPCDQPTPYAGPTQNVTATLSGLQAQTDYGYRIIVKTANGVQAGPAQKFKTANAVKDVTTLPASDVHVTSATLNGSLDPDGIPTTYYFQYGFAPSSFNNVAPVAPPGAPAGEAPGATPLSANVTGLTIGRNYVYRLVGVNSIGTTIGPTQQFRTSDPPGIDEDYAERVNTDSVTLRALVSPNGFVTDYHFEYGPEPCSTSACAESPVFQVGAVDTTLAEVVEFLLVGLEPGEEYHFRIIATNSRGTTVGPDRRVRTYFPDSGVDTCQNRQARQQAGASLLLDCRSYELVSAGNAGGFDVLSDVVPGGDPYIASPLAGDRLLYSVDSGIIPGVNGSPTNFGRDPYVAERDPVSGEWETRYVGLDSDGMAQAGSFGSPVLDTSSALDVFAFGGPDICDPCFGDGSTNIPVRLSDGSLIAGMSGPTLPPAGERNPAGTVLKPLSADGSHLVFGATKPFHPDGNDGSVTIYDRDLETDTTQVVSTTPAGTTMTGDVGQLDISRNGSRIVFGARLATDPAGNSHWHPYMHRGTSESSIDLAPGVSGAGALYAGMSADGTAVLYTTTDSLVPGDTDASRDLYRATVGASGPPSISLVSSGGNSDGCDPVANSDGENWNAVGGSSPESCGVVALAGGAGVAPETGAAYFLTPETLGGAGTANEPNLFVAEPGDAPELVTTLEADNPAVRHAVADNEIHRYGDFQVSGTGQFAVFNSALELTEVPTFDRSHVYRFAATGGAIDCASCAPSLSAATTDTTLPEHGSALTDDGRVFFTSAESLALRDTNGKRDAYEWTEDAVQLISTGTGTDHSGLLGVTADGTNAYFFTRDTLVNSDFNGSRLKIYAAREDGGIVFEPPPLPCAAPDECRGAGTASPPPADIASLTGAGIIRRAVDVERCQALSRRALALKRQAGRLARKAGSADGKRRRALRRKARSTRRRADGVKRRADACSKPASGRKRR